MPGTSIGDATRNSSAAAWASGQVLALGALVTPSTANGLVFIVTTAGTTAASEPGWNTPPYPTLGTTFTDGGGVIFTTYGTQPGKFPIIIQLPVDADPPLGYAQVVPEQSIADQLAWGNVNYGILSANNTWTGSNTFNGEATFNTATFFNSENIFNNPEYSIPSQTFNAYPGTGLYFVSEIAVGTSGNSIRVRTYSSQYGTITSYNCSWTGTQWEYDDSSQSASLTIQTYNAFQILLKTPFQSSPWNQSTMTSQFNYVLGTGLTITQSVTCENALSVTASVSVGAQIEQVFGQATSGNYGCGTVIYSGNGFSIGSSSHDVFGGVASVPAAGFYEIKLYLTTASPKVLENVVLNLVAPGLSADNPLLANSQTGAPYDWTYNDQMSGGVTIPFYANAAGAVTLGLQIVGGTGTAAVVLIGWS